MKIFIPTRGRERNQRTLLALTPTLRARTILVTDEDMGQGLRMAHGSQAAEVWEAPPGCRGIAAVRQFIVDEAEARTGDPLLVMLDDDLTIWKKVPSEETKSGITTRDPTLVELESVFERLESWLTEGSVHAGLTPRFLNWDTMEPFIENSRMMHVLAYDTRVLKERGHRFTKDVDHSFSMDDFHMTLQLLRAGLGNRVITDYVSNPSPSNSKGGASGWRSLESHNASARRLAELNPGFVRVSPKQGWQGMPGERLDVTIQWQKAYNSGKVK